MRLLFRPLVEEDALAILEWQYLPPYDYYNFNANNTQEDLRYLLTSSRH